MNVAKEGAILQRATAGDELRQTLSIDRPQLRPDSQDCFGFGRKIERVFSFVVVEPMHAVAIVEDGNVSGRPVGEAAMKPAVQLSGKIGLLFCPMDKIRSSSGLERVTALLQPGFESRIGKLFSGKKQAEVALLVVQGHAGGEGSPARYPSHIETQTLIDAGPRNIERLVLESPDHTKQLGFGAFAR